MFQKYLILCPAVLGSVFLPSLTSFASEPLSREQIPNEAKRAPVAIADHFGDALEKEADRGLLTYGSLDITYENMG